METLEIAFVVLTLVAGLGALSKRLLIPPPILQVVGGLLLSFAPDFSNVHIDPSIFFALFIPPLLFSEAWMIPKRELAGVLKTVLWLALGLVTLTVLVVGYIIHIVIPAMPLPAAFALGAIISPTDAVAISAISEKLNLPSRLIRIINGESLINDASGLVAFKVAVAAIVTGVFSWQETALNFLILSVGGMLTGFAIAWVIGAVRVWLVTGDLSEPVIQSTLSLLTPFAAYFAAESVHFSGILAVVAAGIYAGMHDTRHLTTENRFQTWELWSLLSFTFNGVVFVLLGLQLRSIFFGLAGYSWGELAAYTGIVYASILITRMAWIFVAAYVPVWQSRKTSGKELPAQFGQLVVLGCAGIRGSVTLAAALSLPFLGSGTQPFPARDLIIFLAAGVIVITLVIHGLTLPILINRFNITSDGIAESEEKLARIAISAAAIKRLEPYTGMLSSHHEKAYAARIIAIYQRRIQHLTLESDERAHIGTQMKVERNIRLTALDAEREELFFLNTAGHINEEVLRKIQREIDHHESALLDPEKNLP